MSFNSSYIPNVFSVLNSRMSLSDCQASVASSKWLIEHLIQEAVEPF